VQIPEPWRGRLSADGCPGAGDQAIRRVPAVESLQLAGTTMIGQGQMMLGDPLNWMVWLVGVDAGSFDIKFCCCV
jgi:hypothetical protein